MNDATLPSPGPQPSRRRPGALAAPGRGRGHLFRRAGRTLVRWFDSGSPDDARPDPTDRRIDWFRVLPFLALHVACGAILFVGWSPIALLVAVWLYVARMFAVTAFYHRYFSHRAFKANRFWQLLFAVAGNTAVQRGPLWWAAHHRNHHRRSDQPGDAHSPVQDGFFWSHVGWFLSRGSFATDTRLVPDFAKYPELRFLDRFNVLVPLFLAGSLYGLGEILRVHAPGLGTDGWQMLVWGFVVSTVVLYHATFTINSLAHRFGSRPYETRDDSRNSLLLALLTFGEGWHNNHHHYPMSARQGFRWWEVDLTFSILKVLEALGIVKGLKPVPVRVRDASRRTRARKAGAR